MSDYMIVCILLNGSGGSNMSEIDINEGQAPEFRLHALPCFSHISLIFYISWTFSVLKWIAMCGGIQRVRECLFASALELVKSLRKRPLPGTVWTQLIGL